jgi:hypothetical protein
MTVKKEVPLRPTVAIRVPSGLTAIELGTSAAEVPPLNTRVHQAHDLGRNILVEPAA